MKRKESLNIEGKSLGIREEKLGFIIIEIIVNRIELVVIMVRFIGLLVF